MILVYPDHNFLTSVVKDRGECVDSQIVCVCVCVFLLLLFFLFFLGGGWGGWRRRGESGGGQRGDRRWGGGSQNDEPLRMWTDREAMRMCVFALGWKYFIAMQ